MFDDDVDFVFFGVLIDVLGLFWVFVVIDGDVGVQFVRLL